MKRSRFSEEQIVGVLKEAEAGVPVKDLCRRVGVSEATFYHWKAKYGGLEVNETRRLRQLEEENGRLGKVRMCRNPGVLTYDWTKNGGQVKATSASDLVVLWCHELFVPVESDRRNVLTAPFVFQPSSLCFISSVARTENDVAMGHLGFRCDVG
jgi:putative transposase